MKQIRSNVIVTISSFIAKITKDATQNGKFLSHIVFLNIYSALVCGMVHET